MRSAEKNQMTAGGPRCLHSANELIASASGLDTSVGVNTNDVEIARPDTAIA